MPSRPVILESQNTTSVADGATIERRIRISQPDERGIRAKISLNPHSHLVEYPCTDLGGATTWLVPEAIGPNFETSAVNASQNSPG
jgi:hypothetical protein